MRIDEIKKNAVGWKISFEIIDDTYVRRNRKNITGIVIQKNDNIITLQLEHYKESFTFTDFERRIKNVKIINYI